MAWPSGLKSIEQLIVNRRSEILEGKHLVFKSNHMLQSQGILSCINVEHVLDEEFNDD